MPTVKKRTNFFESAKGIEIEQTLQQMCADEAFCTESSYSANTELYPDNLIPFVDKHMNFLRSHSSVDPEHYISNLRLMTRVR